MCSNKHQALERERCLERVSRLRMNPQINSSLMERGPAPCLPPPCRLISISFLLFQLPFPLDHRGWLSLIARTSGAESNGRLLPPGPQRGGTELSRPWDRTALGVGRATCHIPVSPTSFSSPGSLEPPPPVTLQRKTSYTHNGILQL